MAVILVHQGPTVTRESYDKVGEALGINDSLSDWPVEGILMHAAGEGPSGFRVVDVWESEEAAAAFSEQLQPHLEAAGISDAPELYPAHRYIAS